MTGKARGRPAFIREEAQQQFLRRYGDLGKDVLVSLRKESGISLTEGGALLGISKQAMQQLYERFIGSEEVSARDRKFLDIFYRHAHKLFSEGLPKRFVDAASFYAPRSRITPVPKLNDKGYAGLKKDVFMMDGIPLVLRMATERPYAEYYHGGKRLRCHGTYYTIHRPADPKQGVIYFAANDLFWGIPTQNLPQIQGKFSADGEKYRPFMNTFRHVLAKKNP